MVKVDSGGQCFYIDGYLKANLDMAREVIKKDWDMVFAVDGSEGAGKSVLAQQCALYVDASFDMERIVFTPFEFRKAVMSASKYASIVYDEAYTGLNSRAAMSMINRTLINMLAEIRQKNLFIFVVMPCFFDLDRYVSLWRSRALIHVYTDQNFQRGFFSFYNSEKKKYLFMAGKKFYDYGKVKPNFFGRFTNYYVVDEAKYKNKKKGALTDREQKREAFEARREAQIELFNRLQAIEHKGLTHELRAKILSMPAATYYVWLKKYNDDKDLGGGVVADGADEVDAEMDAVN